MSYFSGAAGLVSQQCYRCGACLGYAQRPATEVLYCESCAQSAASQYPEHRSSEINEFCRNCNTCEGQFRCYCEETGVVLCGRCIEEHKNKFPYKRHSIYQLSGVPVQPPNPYLDTGKERLQANFQRIEACEAIVNKRCDKAIEELNEIRSKLLKKLEKVKEELGAAIELAVQEVLNSLADSRYLPSTPLSQELFDFSQGLNQSEFTVFKFKEEEYQPMKPLWVKIDYSSRKEEKPQPVLKSGNRAETGKPSHFLPILSQQNVSMYVVSTQARMKAVNFNMQMNIGSNPVCSAIDKENFFLCDSQGSPFFVNAKTGQVQQLQPMKTPRVMPGLICRQGRIYLFGGWAPPNTLLRSCECYTREGSQIDVIPDMMYPRDSFNPTVYKQLVYIVGGRGYQTPLPSETYSFEHKSYSLLEFQIQPSPTLCFFLGNVMMAVQSDVVITFDWDKREQKSKPRKDLSWSNAPPYIYGEFLYLLDVQSSSVKRIALKSFQR